MAKRLFGTDGMRGRAGEFPLDDPTIERLGRALVDFLREGDRRGRLVIGHDTRVSSQPLCRSLLSGILAAGGRASLAGVLPTPGVAYLTASGGFDAGIVISASHNSYQDNGVKIFQADGTKLPDEDELRLEKMVLDEYDPLPAQGPVSLEIDESLMESYCRHLIRVARGWGDLSGAKVVLDCANGASVGVARQVSAALGMDVIFLADQPDGTNINRDCGSMHPAHLQEAVRRVGADLGLAFDGDADRCLVVDDSGRILDGDFILYLVSLALKRRGLLRTDAVVATVMSNLWLEQHLARAEIRLVRTSVGDKYVLQEMVRGDHVLGGEQSGHIIFREHATTGDGLLTGLSVMAVWKTAGGRLSDMVADITPCPQMLLNVEVRQKPNLENHPDLGPVLARARDSLNGRGRLLVRYSGTEPLARVMTEGNDSDEIRRIAEEVAEALRAHLG